ncbi:unnamed protein product [Cunninghamella echinulata]
MIHGLKELKIDNAIAIFSTELTEFGYLFPPLNILKLIGIRNDTPTIEEGAYNLVNKSSVD